MIAKQIKSEKFFLSFFSCSLYLVLCVHNAFYVLKKQLKKIFFTQNFLPEKIFKQIVCFVKK